MYNIILDYLQPIKHVFGGQIYVIVVQGGISWQPFWRPQKISQSFRKARICKILRQKCRICKITKTLYLQIFASKMSPFQIPKTRIYPMFLKIFRVGFGYRLKSSWASGTLQTLLPGALVGSQGPGGLQGA